MSSYNNAAQQPHSILKKTHPASLSGTPRSRSPVSSFRGGGEGSSPSSGAGTSAATSTTDSTYSNSNVSLDIHNITPTASTPFYPSPLRSEAVHTAHTDEDASSPQASSSSPIITTAQAEDEGDGGAPTNATPLVTSQQSNKNLPSILRSTPTSNSIEDASQGGDHHTGSQLNVNFEESANSPRGPLLSLPASNAGSGEASASSSSTSVSPLPSSHHRSASPMSADRSRIVGRGGYGGRRGGPSLSKNRTSSSGGLSDVDMRPGYERKVGFDTMIDADDTPNGYFTFCLQVKSRGFLRTKNTRTFMCAVDDNGYSERALEWLMESLVSDGDEIVAVRILDGDPDEIDQDAAREEARELMASIVELNDEYGDRSISIVVEFVAGRVTNTILALIYMYRPDSITVGTRGRSVSAFQKMLGGSFIGSHSRDILNQSPVPVVIVRPEAKVKKHLAKRQNDPKRRSYHDLVALSKEDHLPLSVGAKRSSSQSLLSVPRHNRS